MGTNKTKIVLACTGPDRLTTYNEEVNSQVKKTCRRTKTNQFKPVLEPCLTGNVFNRKCPYLEIKTYK